MHQRCDAFTDKNYNHRNSLDALGDSRPCAILHFVHSQCRVSIKFTRQPVLFFSFISFPIRTIRLTNVFSLLFIRHMWTLMSNNKMPDANVFGRASEKIELNAVNM